MTLIAELKNLKVFGSGDKAEGRVYIISLTMSLIDSGKVVFERTFSETHEGTIKMTMDIIRDTMNEAKIQFEDEQTLKSDADKEIISMTDYINEVKL